VDKPINLLIYDIKQEIINTINNSKLPISIIQLIMQELMSNVNNQTQQSLVYEKQQYENSLKEENKNIDNEG
jgi:hypothetical protein